MPASFKEKILAFNDAFLVEQYAGHADEYTPEALAIMEEQIRARNLAGELEKKTAQKASEPIRYNREEFVPLNHPFSQIDLLLAQLVLREEQIPFFVNLPTTSMLPVEAPAVYTISVHRDSTENAQAALAEHFEASAQGYARKNLSVRERLRGFVFAEMGLDYKAMHETLDITFERPEKKAIRQFALRLVAEADTVEAAGDRTIFYYDNLENLVDILADDTDEHISLTDLLTVIEILQIYMDDPAYPPLLDDVAGGIMTFIDAR